MNHTDGTLAQSAPAVDGGLKPNDGAYINDLHVNDIFRNQIHFFLFHRTCSIDLWWVVAAAAASIVLLECRPLTIAVRRNMAITNNDRMRTDRLGANMAMT